MTFRNNILQKMMVMSLLLMFFCSSTLEAQSYCASKGNQPWESWISTVFIAGTSLNNQSGKTQYSNFTSQSATIKKGESQEITLVGAWSYTTWDLYWRVWIDYNKNGVFENSEQVAQKRTPAPANGTADKATFANFTIPETAKLGNTRMRVSMKRASYPGPCQSFAIGEVEDYTIKITAGTNGSVCPLTASFSNITCNNDQYFVDVTVESANANPNSEWTLIGSPGVTYPYNQSVNLGPYPSSSNSKVLNIKDINSTNGNTCETGLFIPFPNNICDDNDDLPTPSQICPITATSSNLTCDDNNTPNNPNDDLFSFDVVVRTANQNPNARWRYNGNNYRYNRRINLGPFPLADNVQFIFIKDLSSRSGDECETTLVVDPPFESCGGGTSPVGDSCDDNLLSNPGFESNLTNWGKEGNVDVTSNTGNISVRAAEFGSGGSRVYQSLNASAGNTFTLKASLKSRSGNKSAGVSIKFLSSSFQPLVDKTEFATVGTSYTTVQLTETAPANTAYIEVSVRGFGSRVLVADDVCLLGGGGGSTTPTTSKDLRLAFRTGTYTGSPGSVANFKFNLINGGTSTVTEDYRIGFVLSTDNSFSNNDIFVGQIVTGNTSPGTTANIDGAITIPAGTAAGSYFLIAKADFDNAVSETNENNNVRSRAFTVSGGGGSNPPTTGTANCAAESAFPWHEWISRIRINGLVKNSDRSTYSDFTGTSFTFGKDGNNSIALIAKYSYQTAPAYWRVWIDYNQNGAFEANEIFFQRKVSAVAPGVNALRSTQKTHISIPNNAKNGATRMRVIVSRNGFADPCGTVAFGEVEDYTAVIGASSATMNGEEELFFSDPQMVNLAPNPAEDQVIMGLDKMAGQPFELMVSNQLGQIILRRSFEADELSRYVYDISNLSTGMYFVWLKAEGKRSIPQKLIKQKL